MILLVLSTSVGAEEIQIESLGDGIYVHHGVHQDISEGYHGDICNLSFIVGSKGVAVIDTGGSLKVGNQLREAIQKITSLPILYVINTHVHPDHIYGNAAFVADKPAFIGHAKLAEAMERRRENYTRINQSWLGPDATGSEIVKPTMAVEKHAELDLGDRTLQLDAYPSSHTNTDLTVKDSKTSTLWSGDLLFVERTPSIDGDIKGWIQSIDQIKMQSLQKIVPGHGAIPPSWKEALANEQRYLTTLLNDVRNSIKKGEVMESTMSTAAQSEKDKWVLFDIVNRRNVNNIYPGLEWE